MRKFKTVKIEGESRDQGKTFLLVEMPAMQAEKWATRAMLALGRSGIDVPDEAIQSGAAGLMAAGIAAFTKLPFSDAEPLLDEMMGCVHVVIPGASADPVSGRPASRPLSRGDDFNDGDIEEVTTLLKLRAEVAELHLGFSIPAALSELAANWIDSRRSHSPTSRKPAARRSPRAKPA